MNSQLQIPCLGRPFCLGMLYNCYSEKPIPGITLWSANKLKSALLSTKLPACDIETTTEDSLQSKSLSLGIGAELKLSLMSGMVDIKGAAKFLHDRKSSEKQSRVTLQYKSTSHFEQLTMDQLCEIQHPGVADSYATHVVTGITYGADAFLVFDRLISKGEKLDEVSGSMDATIKKIPSYLGGGSTRNAQDCSKIDKLETEKFNCKLHGDFIPESNPTTFDEALKLCKELPKLLQSESKPKVAHLMPLSQLVENYQQVVRVVPLNLIHQVEEIMEHFHHIEIRATDIMMHTICNSFVDIKNDITKFVKLHSKFRESLVEQLSQILPSIRSSGVLTNLEDLISSFYNSPFNAQETNAYLGGKENEIKQLTQHLKNLKVDSRIQYDFPDTECDLVALKCDNKVKHIVCFAFNVTSITSPHTKNLDCYIKTKKLKQAPDTKEWFDCKEQSTRLRLEIEKFLQYVEDTSLRKEKMSYVVTSLDRTLKHDPCILVYTAGDPMLLSPPTDLRATNITIDSIRLQWTNPLHFRVSSYKVLYRPKGESEFKSIESYGVLTDRYIGKLYHGIEYEFSVQATSTSGFVVNSDIACISTTEYYDIVLIGKTGQGKSTLGNKLLDLENTDESNIHLFSLEASTDERRRFLQADDPEVVETSQEIFSVTKKCKIMSNESSKIRVLDVPGFSDSGTLRTTIGQEVSVYKGNLQIVRWLVREQIQSQLKVRRIVYFLPVRGPLEKADGTMQEELKVLHHYFGKDVFNCLVVAATNFPKERYQALGFDEDDHETTKRVFHSALKMATEDSNIFCPPIIHLCLCDSPKQALEKVQTAPVLKESILPLRFSEEVCAQCSCKILYSKENNERICAVDPEKKSISYVESKCHPGFVPKYTPVQKVAGGMAHIAVLGSALVVGHVFDIPTWPGFTNSDEVCRKCKMPPGLEGCMKVGEDFTVEENVIVRVDHSNEC